MVRITRHNSTYPKGGVSCSKDSFVVNQTLVFQLKFCGKSPALRVAAKRYLQLQIQYWKRRLKNWKWSLTGWNVWFFKKLKNQRTKHKMTWTFSRIDKFSGFWNFLKQKNEDLEIEFFLENDLKVLWKKSKIETFESSENERLQNWLERFV